MIMELGAFSISLNVKNIKASRDFYAKLGFEAFAGDITQNWLVLKNQEHIIGLFQGMLEQNTLTFNPGWDQNAVELPQFTDIRDLQRHIQDLGLNLLSEVDPDSTGPASLILLDPDGNPILIDQHV
jgi:lactoylglutathione lyase